MTRIRNRRRSRLSRRARRDAAVCRLTAEVAELRRLLAARDVVIADLRYLLDQALARP